MKNLLIALALVASVSCTKSQAPATDAAIEADGVDIALPGDATLLAEDVTLAADATAD